MGELVLLEPGRKVNEWVIEKKLGEGAFGAVYRCNNGKGDLFALKVEGKNEAIQLLKLEVYVLNDLGKAGGRHFCKIEDKYAPVACHMNREQCRLDDCETWLYMLVELTKGTLPWRNMKDIREIGDAKRGVRMSELGLKQLFGGCPREYIDVLRVIDGAKFFDEPDYAKMYNLLRQGMRSTNAREYPYDWEEFLMRQMEEEKKKKEKGEGSAKAPKKEKNEEDKQAAEAKKQAILDQQEEDKKNKDKKKDDKKDDKKDEKKDEKKEDKKDEKKEDKK
ncbi:unnamed protein product, partial [Mesorhabditis spiculigera]